MAAEAKYTAAKAVLEQQQQLLDEVVEKNNLATHVRFGKAGIPWHGGMAIWKHVPGRKAPDRETDSLDSTDASVMHREMMHYRCSPA